MAQHFRNQGPPRPRRDQDRHQPLYGRQAIADYVGKHKNTITRWVERHGFPAARDPSGQYVTTPGLIESWILSQATIQAEAKAIQGTTKTTEKTAT